MCILPYFLVANNAVRSVTYSSSGRSKELGVQLLEPVAIRIAGFAILAAVGRRRAYGGMSVILLRRMREIEDEFSLKFVVDLRARKWEDAESRFFSNSNFRLKRDNV